jgi:hypothetical protein
MEGKGMGYAKAAELNGYPGPAHVLELGEELGLSAEQGAQTRAIFERMREKAKQLGAELVETEAALDKEFRARTITEATLSTHLERIGALHGKLRHAHLAAHLEQTRILTQHQISIYMRLRGYGEAAHARHHEHR